MLLHAFGGHLSRKMSVVLRLVGDDPHVCGVALVTGPGVCEMNQFDLCHLCYASTTDIRGCTSSFGINAGQYATISSAFGRPAPKPVTVGGPFSTRGAISRVNRSTWAL